MISSSNENADVFMLWEWFPKVQSVRESITTANVYDFQMQLSEEYNNRAIINWELSQSMPMPLLRGQRCQPLSLLIVCVYVE